MALGKRKFTTGRGRVVSGRKVSASYANRAKRARVSGRTGYANILRIGRQVGNLTRMIETKTAQWTSPSNVNMPHNDTYVVQMAGGGGDLNPLRCTNGTDDPMVGNTGSRIGDRVTVKGLAIRGMVECSLQRSKVHFRLMLVKCPRGQAPNLAGGLFMGCSGNKMIDTVNTEKFTIVWQTRFNVSTSNPAPSTLTTVPPTGVPVTGTPAGIGAKTFSAWIPGKKFGKGGNINYENTSSINPKFFDYRLVILCYDWFGTPTGNNVGVLNEMYTKLYFKDA